MINVIINIWYHRYRHIDLARAPQKLKLMQCVFEFCQFSQCHNFDGMQHLGMGRARLQAIIQHVLPVDPVVLAHRVLFYQGIQALAIRWLPEFRHEVQHKDTPCKLVMLKPSRSEPKWLPRCARAM